MNTKICTKCNITKSLDCFYKQKNRKDGYRSNCKECVISTSLNYYTNNLDSRKDYGKKYYLSNTKDRINYQITYRSKRKKEDDLFRFSENLRNRIYSFLKKNKISKQNTTFNIVGCSPSFLREYISAKFQVGMTWDNYGKWHLDHIIPLSSAKTEDEMFVLFHYKNLQPLWAEDNLKKGNKII